MSAPIHVVKVEKERSSFRVYFSEPVYLNSGGYDWLSRPSTDWWCEDDSTDELGAFQWGLKVIQEHLEKEQTNAQNT